jgi:Tfp pilus assembly protein PilF
MRCFDKSIEMYPHSSLPYINKGMLYLQVKNDPVTAETLLKKAIDLDPLSDIAYGPLAQLYLTQNRVEEAIEIYNRAIEFARTEQELCAGFCCREAAAAQLNIKESYPEIYSRLIAAQMAMMRQQQMQGQ